MAKRSAAWTGRVATLIALVAVVLATPVAAHAQSPNAAQALTPSSFTRDDASWGSPSAPVTMVVFTDLQCPFCARLEKGIASLKKSYGPKQLRIVYQHFPLGFHAKARPAADAAAAVWALYGARGFFRFVDGAFKQLRAGGDWKDVARSNRLSVSAIERALASGLPQKKVDADLDRGRKLGVRGTPATFINGVLVSGARPAFDFEAVIDAELAALRTGSARGAKFSADRTTQNYKLPKSTARKPSSPAADKTIWKVDLGRA
ncbi:MAG: thioredoxin domain-containing protein, partial [Myxococcota bacterium]